MEIGFWQLYGVWFCVTAFTLAIYIFMRREDLRRIRFRGTGASKKHHSACVVWLHGTGDSGYGFKWLQDKSDQLTRHVKWVLPDAKVRAMTFAEGGTMRAWMDVDSFPITPEDLHDAEGLDNAVQHVHTLLEGEEAGGMPAERIVLGGFSQGAAVALWAAHMYPRRLAGVILWSGYAPCAERLPATLKTSANRLVPHVHCHGSADEKVLPACGTQVAELLSSAEVPLKTSVHEGVAHGCCQKQVEDLLKFLRKRVPSDPKKAKDPTVSKTAKTSKKQR
mmetsp:Transcript_35081/g.111481  ORF Transcript_35081/g.111481 Transcript_35081/m.111481 type:complete len:278 (-) Transcript_35081:541-1374(-)